MGLLARVPAALFLPLDRISTFLYYGKATFEGDFNHQFSSTVALMFN